MGSGQGSIMRNVIVCSLSIVRVIKSRKLKWADNIARMEEGCNAFKMLTGKPSGKRPL